jgi:hypothetical protein
MPIRNILILLSSQSSEVSTIYYLCLTVGETEAGLLETYYFEKGLKCLHRPPQFEVHSPGRAGAPQATEASHISFWLRPSDRNRQGAPGGLSVPDQSAGWEAA